MRGAANGRPVELAATQLERPERDGITGAEAARLAVDRIGFQRRLHAGSCSPSVKSPWPRSSTNCATAIDGIGPLIVRIEHAQHGVGDFGEIVVELVARAGVEVGEGLDQPLDVRIFGRIGAQPQPAGDLRMRLGELGAQSGG